ncbi:pyrin-like [Astyanax mexicanus]|uniref:pyrin-like n=1 Tax=Astyanax mexicanus TaxID=7994 RepID=UPI0020CB30CA|nr:pyrin-like [Astyanax mexicanus]
MEEKRKAAERQAEDLIKDLEQEITELKRRDTELEQLSHTEDHLHLLQIFPSLCRPPHTTNWTNISTEPYLSVETVRKALSQLQKSLNDQLYENELKKIKEYKVDVTLDPEKAHASLVLSQDGKQVRKGIRRVALFGGHFVFYPYTNVLGKQGFSSGKFYYEVQVKGKTSWVIGVAKESITSNTEFTLCPAAGFWILTQRDNDCKVCKACHNPPVLLSLKEKPQKVGVFVDYEEGLVSFYDVEARSHIYSFTGQSFTGLLYPYFNPGPNEGGKNSAPLTITPISNMSLRY